MKVRIMSKKKAAKKSTPKPKPSAPKKVTTPRQAPMFDEDYVEARDNRMEYGAQEVQIKGELLAEMKKLGKTDYVRGNIEIHIVTEEETVKVKIRKEEKVAAAGV